MLKIEPHISRDAFDRIFISCEKSWKPNIDKKVFRERLANIELFSEKEIYDMGFDGTTYNDLKNYQKAFKHEIDALILRVTEEKDKIFPTDIYEVESYIAVIDRTPCWLSPLLEEFNVERMRKLSEDLGRRIEEISNFTDDGNKPRILPRRIYISNLKSIFEDYSSKKATASKSYDSPFHKFVNAFLENSAIPFTGSSAITRDSLYNDLKKL